MSELLDQTKKALELCRIAVAGSPWWEAERVKFTEILDGLLSPCIVAVSGEVKTGKSRFVNALLGEDIAPVGEVPTTATQIRFVYATREHHRRVTCHYRNGNTEEKDMDFLRSFQGSDPEVMARAKEIKFFEVLVNNPYLRGVILVDTPGINANVEEHQKVAEEVILEKAAAIIYFTRFTARDKDLEMIESFQKLTGHGSYAVNALGVMGRIDLDREVLENRKHLASRIERSLSGKLLMVLPVSSALHQAVRDESRLVALREQLLQMPHLEDMLDEGRAFFVTDEQGDFDCPFSAAERREMVGDILWDVFQIVATALVRSDKSVAETRNELLQSAGFIDLDKVLREQFFNRAEIFQCCTALTKTRAILDRILRENAYDYDQLLVQNAPAIDAVKTAILRLPSELRVGLENLFTSADIKKTFQTAISNLDNLLTDLLQCTSEFHALKLLHENLNAFSDEEVQEMKYILGEKGVSRDIRLQGVSDNSVGCRQLYWQRREGDVKRPIRDIIQAVIGRYSVLH